MDVTDVLLDILIVLVAAKVAAELMERINVPAVVGEILAGILIGPSALDLVSNNDVLRVLGEIGVILLLLEVGSELELSELICAQPQQPAVLAEVLPRRYDVVGREARGEVRARRGKGSGRAELVEPRFGTGFHEGPLRRARGLAAHAVVDVLERAPLALNVRWPGCAPPGRRE